MHYDSKIASSNAKIFKTFANYFLKTKAEKFLSTVRIFNSLIVNVTPRFNLTVNVTPRFNLTVNVTPLFNLTVNVTPQFNLTVNVTARFN